MIPEYRCCATTKSVDEGADQKTVRQFSLRDRFEAFVRTLTGFEGIDALLQTANRQGKKRADYLFWDRRVIVEQKSLEADPAHKAEEFTTRLIRERRLVLYGAHSTREIFSDLPDGEDLQRRMVQKVGKVIEDNVANADKQTRDTREILAIPNAAGVLVLLNEAVSALGPDIIHYELARSFQKKNGDKYRYCNNDGVILLTEAHPVAIRGFERVFPIFTFFSPECRNRGLVTAFSDMLEVHWSLFNGRRLIRRAQQPPAS